ncbi:DUF7125 family protein [Halobellus ruber]|uniref:KaiC-like domain-containing protein n=1 Tax=Halobellus ruber TaxID=2761102 RepID=A0A7J9SK73_9EURY|nr:hypothetical protein [Halobellus ruber]MBB6647360.1 hypothetical protein [Halobellus ruber]
MSIPTGIDRLDERLDGGVLPGTLFVITLPPGGEYIPLIRDGLKARRAVILTSLKSETLIRKMLERSGVGLEDVALAELDPGKAPETIPATLDTLDSSTSLYVNAADPIEKSVPTDLYVDLMNLVSERLYEVGTTGYLSCYRDGEPRYNRTVTLNVADFVVEIERVHEAGRLTHRLRVPKANGVALTESDRTFEVTIDQAPPGA